MIAKLLASVNSSLKAHAAGLGAAVTLLLADLDVSNSVSLHQWVAIVGAYLGVGAAVHIIPNAPAADLSVTLDKVESAVDDGLDA